MHWVPKAGPIGSMGKYEKILENIAFWGLRSSAGPFLPTILKNKKGQKLRSNIPFHREPVVLNFHFPKIDNGALQGTPYFRLVNVRWFPSFPNYRLINIGWFPPFHYYRLFNIRWFPSLKIKNGGFPYLKIKKLSNFHFMFFKEFCIQAVGYIFMENIISDPHLHNFI